MDKNYGGSAFPTLDHEWTDDGYRYGTIGGMTLRDYFAAKAMQGMLANIQANGQPEAFAKSAYEIADAMIKERDNG